MDSNRLNIAANFHTLLRTPEVNVLEKVSTI